MSQGTPKKQHTAFDDKRMEYIMGRLLQVGVLFSSAVVLIGGVLFLLRQSGHVSHYRIFKSEPNTLRSLKGLASLLASGSPEAIIMIGVLLLIATPIARVVFAAISFALERDLLYLLISLTVLGVLIFGLLHST